MRNYELLLRRQATAMLLQIDEYLRAGDVDAAKELLDLVKAIIAWMEASKQP